MPLDLLNPPRPNVEAAHYPGPADREPLAWLPAGAWDCHVHVFEARYPFCPERRFTPGEAPLAALRALRQRLGLGRSVIVQPSVYGTDNQLLVASLEQEQGLCRGVAVIDPELREGELLRLHEAGVRGVRLNLQTQGQEDPVQAREQLQRLAERIRGLGWHVQVYSQLPLFAALQDTLANLPCRVVLDHFAGVRAEQGIAQPGFAALLALLQDGNVYLKLSAPSRVSRLPGQEDLRPLVAAVVAANPGRLLWGSDWPHTGGLPGERREPTQIEAFRPVDDGENLERLAHWLADPGLLRAIWQTNPDALYG